MTRSLPAREDISVDEALRRILTGISTLPSRPHVLTDAVGLVLAEQVVSSIDSPRFETVAMDGFAVRSADTVRARPQHPVRLKIAGEATAGQANITVTSTGSAVRVTTGTECPPGADAVLPFERVGECDGVIEISGAISAGANVRRTGEDFSTGQTVLEVGIRLLPGHMALLAGLGHAEVTVHPRPRVTLIATGDELIEPGQALEPGQIWDSNSVMVSALIRQFGGEIAGRARVRDSAADLAEALRSHAGETDLIVTVGSASRGDRDVLADLAEPDITISLWDVQMKPGRPLVLGRVSGTPLIGLPGNPVAAFVSAIQFVRPVIMTMSGRLDLQPPVVPTRVAEPIANPGGKRAFIRVRIERTENGLVAGLAGPQNAANLLTLGRADGLLVIPEAMNQVPAGAVLPVQLLADL